MKTKILCLFVLLLTLNGCNDDEPKNEPDFSVLGIKNIAINDLVIGLDASGLRHYFPVVNAMTWYLSPSSSNVMSCL